MSTGYAVLNGETFEVTDLAVVENMIGNLPSLGDLNLVKVVTEDLQVSYTEVESWDWGIFNILKIVIEPIVIVATFAVSIVKIVMDFFLLLGKLLYFFLYIIITVLGFRVT